MVQSLLSEGFLPCGLMICLLGLHTGPSVGGVVSIYQPREVVTSLRGDTVTLSCNFSVPGAVADPSVKCAVQWSRAGVRRGPGLLDSDQAVLNLRPPRLSLAFPEPSLAYGDASLVITDVGLEDAGIYYCSVTVFQRGTATGNGTSLLVYAPPSTPKVFLKISPAPTQESWSLVYSTRGFHPAEINVSWIRESSPQSPVYNQPSERMDQTTVSNLVSESLVLYEESSQGWYLLSHLPVDPRTSSGDVYTCTVQHVSLRQPLTASFHWDEFEKIFPLQLIGCLNVVKIILLCGLALLFTVAGVHQCRP
ncbi:tapasin-related protein-like [Huso huso]|uniref:Tapasin-related protein-like n=1 Tax=Huso huso TaxID=61971 RepID=A0ABR0YBB2_HUSHU